MTSTAEATRAELAGRPGSPFCERPAPPGDEVCFMEEERVGAPFSPTMAAPFPPPPRFIPPLINDVVCLIYGPPQQIRVSPFRLPPPREAQPHSAGNIRELLNKHSYVMSLPTLSSSPSTLSRPGLFAFPVTPNSWSDSWRGWLQCFVSYIMLAALSAPTEIN